MEFLISSQIKKTIMNIYEVAVSVKLSLSKKQLELVRKTTSFAINTDFITFSELQAANNAAEAKEKVKNKYKQLLPFYNVKTSKANSIVNNK